MTISLYSTPQEIIAQKKYLDQQEQDLITQQTYIRCLWLELFIQVYERENKDLPFCITYATQEKYDEPNNLYTRENTMHYQVQTAKTIGLRTIQSPPFYKVGFSRVGNKRLETTLNSAGRDNMINFFFPDSSDSYQQWKKEVYNPNNPVGFDPDLYGQKEHLKQQLGLWQTERTHLSFSYLFHYLKDKSYTSIGIEVNNHNSYWKEGQKTYKSTALKATGRLDGKENSDFSNFLQQEFPLYLLHPFYFQKNKPKTEFKDFQSILEFLIPGSYNDWKIHFWEYNLQASLPSKAKSKHTIKI